MTTASNFGVAAPPADHAGESIKANWTPTEHHFTAPDGTTLFYRAWLPRTTAVHALVLFHRGHEHSGRWQEVIEELNLPDFAAFAWDARGHGRSPGDRGYAESMSVFVSDADAFVRHVSAAHGIPVENMAIVAHSVGGVIAATWVHDFAPRIRGLVLVTPALRVKLYVPFAIPSLRLLLRVRPRATVKSYVKSRMLTHDPEQAAGYDADPLIARTIPVNVLLDLHDTSTRLLRDAAAIQTPTLVLGAGSDWVVRIPPQRRFFERLRSATKEFHVFDGMYHDILHERDRPLVLAKLRTFISRVFDLPKAERSLIAGDRQGFTHDEFQRLRRPLPFLSIRRWAFAGQRLMLRIGGRLSEGMRLGWRTGFDSGLSLDYVYENRPRGAGPLGRFIDRQYLNSIGWRGIRQRRVHLERVLRSAIEQTHASGRPVRLLDIASGPGRYVLETVHKLRHIPISTMLRDYRQNNLDAARNRAVELDLANVTVALGDAFDRASLAGLTPRPNIAIVSGLFELFPENEPVLRSLRGLADAIDPGGHLIYTNQPWHPQVEFIARVLSNREGKPWIMRRRTQAEMDELVRAAGFEKVGQEIDRWGIFTVSIARRVGP